ncbi:isopenicillin-N N-acyltransferase-like protein [Brevibacterium sanguinis]|uniref:Isopenicillin-N N-acyltransferase-like protein n=2 Tax=Brevibacterium TaxID=1696 RepID=A0A366IDT6_9MICO|nr:MULTISPECIES: C45 family peptidase [Brevibacterium]RBP62502.1 isopenicillin-N N-acyltransferase-like protein [Brevibacterium sanguinis]RBP69166.1 isopenicillin-N N-acyltransferase-like protein [Brevibacterium celere]
MTTTEFRPAASIEPEVFTVRAADHRERGHLRGSRLRDGVARTLAGYQRYFGHLQIAEADVRDAAAASLEALRAWDLDALEEIEAIAAGADITVIDLMTIIARTEIMTLAPIAPTECSTVSFSRPGSSLAAQNWDWVADFSTLWHIHDVGGVGDGESGGPSRPDRGSSPSADSGRQLRHIGFAEYGMLGKVGLNEAGVGVLLNILKHEGDAPGGVPIHMVLERVLSRATTLAEALAIVHSAPTTSSSVITVVTADEAVQVEIANAQKRERRGEGFLLHTNHFLHPDLQTGALELRPGSTSRARCDHLETRIAAARPPETTADLLDILTTGPGEPPVCCAPEPGAVYGERSATLVTVQLDPANRTIELAPGSPADGLTGNRRFTL